MKEDVLENINNYIGYFKKQINEIDQIEGESSKLFKKILYCSVLDALAKVVYPNAKTRDRFICFLRNFSNWKDMEKITVPHLYHLLRQNPDPIYENLRKYISTLYKSSPVHDCSIIKIDQDPEIDQIVRYLPDKNASKPIIQNINLESLKHISLFYAYRNSLIHEYRTPGLGPELSDMKYPFYILRSEMDLENKELVPANIELVYPVVFFMSLCSDCISKLEIYLNENNLDPYEYYKFGSYWYPELNQ